MGEQKQTVAVITSSVRQVDGSYVKSVHSVWSSVNGKSAGENAKAVLSGIAANYNGNEEHLRCWRAKQPIGQIWDLSIQRLPEGASHWVCEEFFSIDEKILNQA